MSKPVNININERITQILNDIFHGNVTAMAKATYINRNTLNSIIGEKQVTPGYDVIRKIVEMSTADINEVWLLTGHGEMLNGTADVTDVVSDSYADKSHLVPLVPIGVFAGSLTGFSIDSADARNCEMVVSPVSDMDWALEVVGDSMETEYPNGSRVFVKKVNSAIFLEWGCVYVIDTENGLVMKSIRPSDNPNCITCVSLNPRYAPFDIPKESIRAMYRVCACLTLK